MRGPELSRGPKAYPSVKSRTRFSQATRFEDPTAVYSEILSCQKDTILKCVEQSDKY